MNTGVRPARHEQRKPKRIVYQCDVVDLPLVGDEFPGHVEIDTLLVDTSGWGSENEPALTQRQFRSKVDKLLEDGPIYMGVVKYGQFQAYVRIWR